MSAWLWSAVLAVGFVIALAVLLLVDRALRRRQAEIDAYFAQQLDDLDRLDELEHRQ